MGIDIDSEALVEFNKPAEYWPTKPPHIATLHRWRLTGVLRDDERVRLETVMLGGRRFTSREAVKRFLSALNADAPTSGDAGRPKSSSKDAGRALSAIGC
jgi:hypothetical protein